MKINFKIKSTQRRIKWEDISIGSLFMIQGANNEVYAKVNYNSENNVIRLGCNPYSYSFGKLDSTYYVIIDEISIENTREFIAK